MLCLLLMDPCSVGWVKQVCIRLVTVVNAARTVLHRGEFSFSGPQVILNWGPFWKVCDVWCHTNYHYAWSLHLLNKLFQFINTLLYSELPSYQEKKVVTTKLTKIAAVKLSDHPPIPYLLSALCNCTVCKCQELALSKASVLLTTRDSLLHSRWSTGLFVCKIAGNFFVLYLSS